MITQEYNYVDAPISHVFEIIEHLWTLQKRDRKIDKASLIKYLSKTPAYTNKALKFLEQFNIIVNSNDNIIIDLSFYKELDGSKEKTTLLIKQHLLNSKPFIEYCFFLSQGKSVIESARLVAHIYIISTQASTLAKIFDTWIKAFNFTLPKKEEIERVSLNFEAEIANNDLLIQEFIRSKLGEAYSKISIQVTNDLLLAIKEYKINGRKALNDAGRSLEDFLRLDFANGINLTKCNGIGQISDELRKHNVAAAKHYSILLALGQIRSMGDAHGVDNKEGERWSIIEQTALSYITLVMSLMVSLLEYKQTRTLIF